jgi:hypothetical protein
MTIPEEEVEAAALTIKAELGKQWNAKPLPGPGNIDDWSASGGSINLTALARAALLAAAKVRAEAMPDAR